MPRHVLENARLWTSHACWMASTAYSGPHGMPPARARPRIALALRTTHLPADSFCPICCGTRGMDASAVMSSPSNRSRTTVARRIDAPSVRMML